MSAELPTNDTAPEDSGLARHNCCESDMVWDTPQEGYAPARHGCCERGAQAHSGSASP